MTRWPDFFIVGAPKAGTTSLYYYLGGHPDIFMPDMKEPHFFNEKDADTPGGQRTLRHHGIKPVSNQKAYLNLFKKAGEGRLIGEASVLYLSDQAAPVRIKEAAPTAKIIMLLREPVSRAYSHYLSALRTGKEKTASFTEALQQDHEYLLNSRDQGSVYIWPSLYSEQVKRYQHVFGVDQVHICLFDDLAADTREVVKDVCAFLGVEFGDGLFFDPAKRYNGYVEARNPLFEWLGRRSYIRSMWESIIPRNLLQSVSYGLIGRQRSKPPLDPMAREFLRPIFHEDILKLQDLIGRDLSSWLE